MKNTPHTVILRCLKPGCPRTKKKELSDLPSVVAEVHSYCPWHSGEGWKEYPEFYYDKKGRRLDWETWKPYK